MKNLSTLLICLLLLLTAAALGYKYGQKREIIKTERDTVYAERFIHHTDTITNWKPKFIPVYVVDSLKDSVMMAIEKLDTTISKNGDTLKLEVERFPYPVSYALRFDLIKRDSIIKVTETIYLDQKENWWDRFNIGIGAGIGVFKDESGMDAAPALSIGLYYKLF